MTGYQHDVMADSHLICKGQGASHVVMVKGTELNGMRMVSGGPWTGKCTAYIPLDPAPAASLPIPLSC